MAKTEKKPHRGLTEKAYDHIVELLITHKLGPGNLIVPHDIAESLGISRSPVMRALQQLEHEGFVRIVPKRGSFVQNSNPKSILGQLMMREAIECQAARLYCGEPVRRNFDHLVELAGAIKGTPASYHDDWDAEIRFHEFLVSLAGFPSLTRVFRNTMSLGFFLRLNLLYMVTGCLDNHLELAKDLVTSAPEEAEQRVRYHLRNGKPAIFEETELLPNKGWDDV